MHRRHATGVKFLDKYQNKQKLGKGAFGDVYLVDDGSGKLSALKMIDKRKLDVGHTDMLDYLQNEICCMNHVKDRNLVELFDVKKDEQYYYMFLEYCDQGDLVKCQAQLPNKVFPMQTTVEYLSQVIKGLEKLHKAGYLHRDIKPQNVLIKNQNGTKVLKIADFGFAKKATNAHGTICGTERFMSPEIYKCGVQGIDGVEGEDYYGYEVDMWAFGVLFFYMLNKAYPFELHPYWTLDQKFAELNDQSKNFSYKAAVEKTNLKITENCTPLMEDLFKKIFNANPEKRIRFNEIRQHPIFIKYFPKASQESHILYMNKFESTLLRSGKMSMVKNQLASKVKGGLQRKKTINVSNIFDPEKEVDFTKERQIVRLELEEVEFLWNFMNNICDLEGLLGADIVNMAAYNLVKYYIFLLAESANSFFSSIYVKKYSKQGQFHWKALFDDANFQEKKKQLVGKLQRAKAKFKELYLKCKASLSEINRINPHFKESFSEYTRSQQLDSSFYTSYRQSTSILYGKLKAELKKTKNEDLYYELCTSCICHVFDELYRDQEQKELIFGVYLNQQKDKTPIFSYKKFDKYLRQSSKSEIIQLAQKIITECL